jgi:hypothetical protein
MKTTAQTKWVMVAAASILTLCHVESAEPLDARPRSLNPSAGSPVPPLAKPELAASSPKKWHPGHYVRADAQAFPKSDQQRFEVYDRIRDKPLFQGGLILCTWGMLEPEQDKYDFSQIDKDLAYLKAMGKRLIIEVWWMKYDEGASFDYFPKYVVDEGGVKIRSNGNPVVRVDETRWMDRLVKLYQALATRYDSDPAVEQLIISETCLTPADEFRRAIPAIAAAWPQTPVILYLNWIESPQLGRELAAICGRYGVGLGGPDIIPPSPKGGPESETHGARLLRGAGKDTSGDWGSTDYRGRIPVSYSYEAYREGGPPAGLIGYALDVLKTTHIVWGVYDVHPGYIAPGWDWPAVLAAVKSVNGRITTGVPTSFADALPTKEGQQSPRTK